MLSYCIELVADCKCCTLHKHVVLWIISHDAQYLKLRPVRERHQMQSSRPMQQKLTCLLTTSAPLLQINYLDVKYIHSLIFRQQQDNTHTYP